ncbi:IQ motif and SEC7 domain-containing protein 1 isoform X2 [Ixodes scapularis]|uniref:IQ motif and SEC7 domain-containing protein 1 isoform X2 n=1 Tax=Ixodes scapularis TaxID=6945 RepID=UPI0011616E2E|nr:IQ motif and SEC7 domain-containing protein 1 isoform X2 [Ixodes scapularis]
MTEGASLSSSRATLCERLHELQKCVEAKDRLIERQCIGIQELEHQVVVLRAERDALLRDIDRLCLQLEVIDLQRLSNGSQPPERGGPPVKQPRPEEAGSAEGAELGALGRGGTPPKKASVRRLDEDALKRSRLHNNQYELSQDLLDKQVEMLERKYGGVRARTAALTIQRAFRSHCMQKRFLDLANASKGERRLSRRIHALDLLAPDGNTPLRHHGWARGSPTPPSEGSQRRVPPQVPRRTSSIPGGTKESSTWKRPAVAPSQSPAPTAASTAAAAAAATAAAASQSPLAAVPAGLRLEDKRLSNISENSEDSLDCAAYSCSPPASDVLLLYPHQGVGGSKDSMGSSKGSEAQRKRQYRVGLNLFNKRPEKGVRYLVDRGFLDACPRAVARFLVSRKGLSKLMIGDYLGNLQCPFNMQVLECFVQELDFAGMQVDLALRKFQSYFILPGEAQKIERLVEVFSHQYAQCNPDVVAKLRSADTLFVLAFSVVLLNTDLHTPSVKADKRMKLDDYVRNLRGVDEGHDLDRDMLAGIYERIKAHPFRPGSDHVSQVLKVQQSIVGKKPNLALAHRRLVCYCRLYEVYDVHKKERPGVHQREVFLFNDLLLVTKIFSKKKNSIQYAFRQSLPLCGMSVALFEAPHYPHGISLSQRVDDRALMTLNARNEHDRCKFVDDLREAILEMDEMENLRIEGELEKQQPLRSPWDQRDSGLADMEGTGEGPLAQSPCLKRSALSNSLLDLHDQQTAARPVRRGSAGSLDSGMSVSFQSSAASSVSREASPHTVQRTADPPGDPSQQRQGFLGGLFAVAGKRTRPPPQGRAPVTVVPPAEAPG